MILKTSTGEMLIPDAQVTAIRHEAVVAAELAVEFLQRCDVRSVPLAFILELAAALRIKGWQKAGLLDQLGEAREPLLETLADFERRMECPDAKWRMDGLGVPLQRMTLSTWLRQFAWFARHELGTDVLLMESAQPSEEEAAAIAEFLWANRNNSEAVLGTASRGGNVHGQSKTA